MPKIDIASATRTEGSEYPEAFAGPCRARARLAIGDVAGLTQFGVNLLQLPPGAWSSLRHWHSAEDEFAWILEGEVVLVTDAGETPLRAGDCAAFRAGDPDAHHLQNRSGRDALVLEMGSRRPDRDEVHYPDAGLHWTEAAGFRPAPLGKQ